MEDFEFVGTIVISLFLWSSAKGCTNRTNVQPSTHLPESCPLFFTEWGSYKNSTIGPKVSITPCVSQPLVLLPSVAQICLHVYVWMNDLVRLRRGTKQSGGQTPVQEWRIIKKQQTAPYLCFEKFLFYFIFIYFVL